MESSASNATRKSWGSFGAALLLLGGMTGWNALTFSPAEARARLVSPELNPLPRPGTVKLLSMGLQASVADYYWIEAVNYFGNGYNEGLCYAQLPGYLHLILELAPDFESAYRFGGLTIPCFNGKEWINADEGIAVLRQGVQHFPQNYFLRTFLAYYLSDVKHDYPAAGEQLAVAAKLPGSPPYVAQLATRMYAAAGDLSKASSVADELLNSLDSDDVRATLKKRKNEIRTLEQLQELNKAREDYEKSQHKKITSVEDLVRAGNLTALPEPALGGTFEYNAETNEVTASELHDSLKIFEHKQRTPK